MPSTRAAVSVVVVSVVVASVGASVTGCAIDAAASSTTVAIIDGRIATDLEAFDCFDIEQPGDGPASDHGTAVASVLLAVSSGDCRWTRGLRVLSIPVLDEQDGPAYGPTIAAALDEAVRQGADLVNISIDLHARDPVLEASVLAAHDAGVTVVAAAGNRLGLRAGFPAAYPGAVSVGAASGTRGGGLASYSACEGVEVAVGADDLRVLNAEGEVRRERGTSLAAALITGRLMRLLVDDTIDARGIDDALDPYRVECP